MNIPKEVIKHAEAIYWDSTDGTEEAAFGVIAEWARREALEEAADLSRRMSENEADGYYGQACYEVATALDALVEGDNTNE
jgi:precorrin-2 methylase